MEILSTPAVVLSARILGVLLSLMLTSYAARSLIIRIRLRMSDIPDWSFLFVALYWLIFNLYNLIVYDGHRIPPLDLYIFNMRFGLLFTIATMIPLARDRLFISKAARRMKEEIDEL